MYKVSMKLSSVAESFVVLTPAPLSLAQAPCRQGGSARKRAGETAEDEAESADELEQQG